MVILTIIQIQMVFQRLKIQEFSHNTPSYTFNYQIHNRYLYFHFFKTPIEYSLTLWLFAR